MKQEKKPITIAVVGPHYAGKSTLCTLLQEKLGFEVVQEQWWKDPFRKKTTKNFFKEKHDFLGSELWFLARNVHSATQARKLNKKGKHVILDTFIYSTLIFAHTVLTKKELRVLKEVFNLIIPTYSLPDLVIYLSADAKFLYETRRMIRVEEKTGPTEDEQTPFEWYKKVWDLNEYYFAKWKKTPLLTIDVEKVDLKNDPKVIAWLKKQIEELTLKV